MLIVRNLANALCLLSTHVTMLLQGWTPLHVAVCNKGHIASWMSDNPELAYSFEEAKQAAANESASSSPSLPAVCTSLYIVHSALIYSLCTMLVMTTCGLCARCATLRTVSETWGVHASISCMFALHI